MTDIVERLRETTLDSDNFQWLPTKLLHEAADEIERLRAALQSLTKDPPAFLAREPDTDAEVIIKMRDIARAALGDQ